MLKNPNPTKPTTKNSPIQINSQRINLDIGAEFLSDNYSDWDASAFGLDTNNNLFSDEYFVFYNNYKSPCESIFLHSGITENPEDDETFTIALDKIPTSIISIIFAISIWNNIKKKNHNFSQLMSLHIRLYSVNDTKEIAKFEINNLFLTESAIELGRLYRQGNRWGFGVIGPGYEGGLEAVIKKYKNNFSGRE